MADSPLRENLVPADKISVWPCDHGGVRVEHGHLPQGFKCAHCGEVSAHYVLASHAASLRTALEELRAMILAETQVDGAGRYWVAQRPGSALLRVLALSDTDHPGGEA